MKIALVGYGRMGKEIEEAALKRGHSVSVIIDVHNKGELNPGRFKEVDVAVEFSIPDSAFDNISKCLQMGIPVVSGTTGWLDRYDQAVRICNEAGTSFIHSTNFSVGVNILFKLNADLAEMMEKHRDYLPEIEEIHHIKKLDAPSGTAITLADGIIRYNRGYKSWIPGSEKKAGLIPVQSVREGTVPGTHTVRWDSETDSISMKHVTHNRKGLALGAVLAAEYISSRKGVFTMNDVLGF